MPSNERPPFVVAATSCYAKKTKGQRGCSFRLWSCTSDTFYIRICLLWVYPMEYVRYGAACSSSCLVSSPNFPCNIPVVMTLCYYLISLRCVEKLISRIWSMYQHVFAGFNTVILKLDPICFKTNSFFGVNKNFNCLKIACMVSCAYT